MVTWAVFDQFSEDLASKNHDLQATGDTLKVYLTNTEPDDENDGVLADLAGITEQNGYAATDIQNDIARTGSVTALTGVDITFTAAGGSFGPFRYAVIYNDTPTSPADPLIAYADYGSSVTVAAGETFELDFNPIIVNIG